LESLVKFVLAILFVFVGWKVYGAMAAVFVGTIFAFLFSFVSMKRILLSREEKANIPEIYKYSFSVFAVITCITVFYSLDVILARSFFSDDVAGFYAMASILAKSIFFATLPISKAMFPLSSEAEKDEKSKRVFWKAFSILSFCIFVALVATYIFPDLLIRIFAGRYVPEAAGILFYVAIAISLISFTNLILLHRLSVGKTKGILIFIFLLIEIILLSIFNGSLFEYSLALIAANAIFLIGSIIVK